MQIKFHLRVSITEFLDHDRQHVARLRMSRPDGKGSSILLFELLGDTPDVLHFPQRAQRVHDDTLTRRRDLGKRATAAGEYPKPQFLFERFELFADGRLGGRELVGSGCEVQIVLDNRGQTAQLLQFHLFARGPEVQVRGSISTRSDKSGRAAGYTPVTVNSTLKTSSTTVIPDSNLLSKERY